MDSKEQSEIGIEKKDPKDLKNLTFQEIEDLTKETKSPLFTKNLFRSLKPYSQKGYDDTSSIGTSSKFYRNKSSIVNKNFSKKPGKVDPFALYQKVMNKVTPQHMSQMIHGIKSEKMDPIESVIKGTYLRQSMEDKIQGRRSLQQ